MAKTSKYMYSEDRAALIARFANGKVLDVGCSQMRFNLSNSIGIDIVPSRNADILADAQYLPFRGNLFDTIVAGELLEHLQNPCHFLDEVKRVLKPGGRLIVTTPNPVCIVYIVSASLGWRSVSSEPEHKYLWDLELLKRFLESCGLKIKASGYINTFRKFVPRMIVRANKRWSWCVFAVAEKEKHV